MKEIIKILVSLLLSEFAAQWSILFPAKTKWIFFHTYINDRACKRNTGLTFLFCTLECGIGLPNFGFPSSRPAIKYLRLLRISSSTNFPRYDPLILEKWYRPAAQNHTLRTLKLQILKVEKKSGLLPEKSQIFTISLSSSSNQ